MFGSSIRIPWIAQGGLQPGPPLPIVCRLSQREVGGQSAGFCAVQASQETTSGVLQVLSAATVQVPVPAPVQQAKGAPDAVHSVLSLQQGRSWPLSRRAVGGRSASPPADGRSPPQSDRLGPEGRVDGSGSGVARIGTYEEVTPEEAALARVACMLFGGSKGSSRPGVRDPVSDRPSTQWNLGGVGGRETLRARRELRRAPRDPFRPYRRQ
jgi:hypothetical protein